MVDFPIGLKKLALGFSFNQKLDGIVFPCLESLSFGWSFNQALDQVLWPETLQHLSFGGAFNQALENVKWPAGLQSLTVGQEFSQSLEPLGLLLRDGAETSPKIWMICTGREINKQPVCMFRDLSRTFPNYRALTALSWVTVFG